MEGALAPWHLILIALLCVVFFGSKRLPDAARSLGQSLRIFKAELGSREADGSIAQPAPSADPVEPEA